ncbi:hypothetical protein ACFJIW_11765 [Tahibacter sp. UC22_41]|uniref:hypothetical protein n=1 Tax=Tahibacter sp. UC22_41 TaxID=3350178 RepID=UPI0036D8BF26
MGKRQVRAANDEASSVQECDEAIAGFMSAGAAGTAGKFDLGTSTRMRLRHEFGGHEFTTSTLRAVTSGHPLLVTSGHPLLARDFDATSATQLRDIHFDGCNFRTPTLKRGRYFRKPIPKRLQRFQDTHDFARIRDIQAERYGFRTSTWDGRRFRDGDFGTSTFRRPPFQDGDLRTISGHPLEAAICGHHSERERETKRRHSGL